MFKFQFTLTAHLRRERTIKLAKNRNKKQQPQALREKSKTNETKINKLNDNFGYLQHINRTIFGG